MKNPFLMPKPAGVVAEIVIATADAFGIKPRALLANRGSKSAIEARQCVYLVARRCTRLSYPELGKELERNHSTVLAGYQSAERLARADKGFAATAAALIAQFGGAP